MKPVASFALSLVAVAVAVAQVRACIDMPTGAYSIGSLPYSDKMNSDNSAITYGTVPFCGTSYDTGPGVWYSFSPSGQVDVVATTCHQYTNFDTKIQVFRSDSNCPSSPDLCVIGDDDDQQCLPSTLDSTVQFTALPAYTYYILVSGYQGATGNYHLSLEGACANSTVPTPLTGVVPFTYPNGNLAYTDESSKDMTCGAVSIPANTPNQWFDVPAGSSPVVVTVCGNSNHPMVASVYTSPCGDFSSDFSPSGNDDAACVTSSNAKFSMTTGNGDSPPTQTCMQGASWVMSRNNARYIQVAAGDQSPSTVGEFTVSFDEAEMGNTCVDPYTMSSLPVTISGVVQGTTSELSSCDSVYPNAISRPFVLLGDGKTVEVSTCDINTDFDTTLLVFEGDSLVNCSESCYAANDDDSSCDYGYGQSTVEINTEQGQLYTIYVSGWGGNTGNYVLHVKHESSLSAGVIAGIVIPSLFCCCCCCLIIRSNRRRRRERYQALGNYAGGYGTTTVVGTPQPTFVPAPTYNQVATTAPNAVVHTGVQPGGPAPVNHAPVGGYQPMPGAVPAAYAPPPAATNPYAAPPLQQATGEAPPSYLSYGVKSYGGPGAMADVPVPGAPEANPPNYDSPPPAYN